MANGCRNAPTINVCMLPSRSDEKPPRAMPRKVNGVPSMMRVQPIVSLSMASAL